MFTPHEIVFHAMQGFYVNIDYHNVAPDSYMNNYTVRMLISGALLSTCSPSAGLHSPDRVLWVYIIVFQQPEEGVLIKETYQL